LRKCLVLSYELKNEKLKDWASGELNGFRKDDVVPEYRKANLFSKGTFSGIGGARLANMPLPLSVLKREHWDWLSDRLAQPIAAYEQVVASGRTETPTIAWPPDLIHMYQSSFIDGYGLMSAWQEVPLSLIVSLCEQVRNRLLRFALELRAPADRDQRFRLIATTHSN
jgi:hypothetical protein